MTYCNDELDLEDHHETTVYCDLELDHDGDYHEAEGTSSDGSQLYAICWSRRPEIVAGEVVTVSLPNDTKQG